MPKVKGRSVLAERPLIISGLASGSLIDRWVRY
jgi:hypothetical protein